MQKTVLFVILEQWSDWESAYLCSAIKMLKHDQYIVKTVSLTKDPVESIGGFRVLPDFDIHSIPNDYEALVLVGGMSWRTEEAKQIKPLVEDCLRNNKVLGAICDASVFLGAIGVLNSVKHTSNEINDLKSWAKEAYTGDDNYIAEQAVRDGNIVTANGTASLEFTKEMLIALDIAPEKTIQEWYNYLKLGCYEAPMPTA